MTAWFKLQIRWNLVYKTYL